MVQSPSERDPTKMLNQPALRTSNGLIWMVMGTLFAAAALIPFGMLAFGDGDSRVVALVCAVAVVVLCLALLLMRVVVRKRVLRLRLMAGCLLAMAAVALIGMAVCAMLENA